MRQKYTIKELPPIDSLLIFSEKFNAHLETNRMHIYTKYKNWLEKLFYNFQDDYDAYLKLILTNTNKIKRTPSLMLPIMNNWSGFQDKMHFSNPDSYGYQCLSYILESLDKTKYRGKDFLFLPVSKQLSAVIYLND